MSTDKENIEIKELIKTPRRKKETKTRRKQIREPPLELSHGLCSRKRLVNRPAFDLSTNKHISKADEEIDSLSFIFDQEHQPRVQFKEKLTYVSELQKGNKYWKKYLMKPLNKMKDSHKVISSKIKHYSTKDSSLNDDECGSVVKALKDDSSYCHSKEELPHTKQRSFVDTFDRPNSISKPEPSILSHLNNNVERGDFLVKAKKYDEAIKCYIEAYHTMKLYSNFFSKRATRSLLNRLSDVQQIISTLKTSSVVMKIGISKENQHQYIRALKCYTVAYRLRRAALGEDNISLVTVLNMLAEVQAKRKEFDEALQIYKMARDIIKKSNPKGRDTKPLIPDICLKHSAHLFLPPPPSTLLRGEGAIHEQTGDLKKALNLYHTSLCMRTQQKKLNSKSPKKKKKNPTANIYKSSTSLNTPTAIKKPPSPTSVTSSISNIDFALTFENVPCGSPSDLNDSFEVVYEPLSLYNPTLTKDDIDIAITLSNIGHVQRRLLNTNVALQAYRSALRGMKLALGENHPNVAALLGNIGNIYKERGDNDLAIKVYNHVLQIETETLGSNHSEITVTLHNMGTIEYCRKNFESAINLFTRAMKIQALRYGPNHSVVAVTANSLGEAYEKANNSRMALKLYRKSLHICTNDLSKDHTEVFKLLQKIGSVYRDIGNFSIALEYYTKAIQLYESDSDVQHHPLVTQIKREMANMNAQVALNGDDDKMIETIVEEIEGLEGFEV